MSTEPYWSDVVFIRRYHWQKSACVELYPLTNLPGRQSGEKFQSAEEKLSHLRLAIDGIPDTAAIQSEFVHHTYTHCVAETEQLPVLETVRYGEQGVKTKDIRLSLIIRNFKAEKENKTGITENSLAFIVLCSQVVFNIVLPGVHLSYEMCVKCSSGKKQ